MPSNPPESLHDALHALGPRPVILTPPRKAQGVRDAIAAQPWTSTVPAVLEVDRLPGAAADGDGRRRGSTVWILYPMPETEPQGDPRP